MRYIFTLFLITLLSLGFAQSPMLVNYQGVARDAGLNPLINQSISLKFEVLQGSATGPVIYTETQPGGVVTNSLGLFTTQIGKNGNLGQVNWQGGPYFLQVSMDAAGGTSYLVTGAQQLVSVPFSMHAESVPSTYTNNILTIGTKTHAISSGPAMTVSQGTGTNITVSGGPNYTVSYAPPILALNANSLSIAGSNTVTLPVAVIPTLVPSGIATVTNGASSYTVGVPAPSYNTASGVLTIGNSNTTVTPTLGLSGGVLYSGPFTNSVAIPGAVTIAGTGQATVTGGPNYLVNVGLPTLTLSSNNLSISIVGSNSVALPAAVTVAAPANNIVSVTGGPANYMVSVPAPVYTGTALVIGATTTTIAPTLIFNGGTLTSGPASNSVNLSGIGPFKQTGTSVELTTTSNNVAIGLSSASARLDVYSNGTTGNVIQASNANSSNSSPALNVSSAGASGIEVNNTSANGIAGNFFSTGGYALFAQNNSSSFPALQVNNTNGSGSAAYFKGGIIAESKLSGNAFTAKSSAASDIFTIREDGFVGVGSSAFVAKLDVNGNLRLGGGSLYLGAVGGVNDGYTGLYSNGSGDLIFSVFKSGGGSAFGGQSIDAVKIGIITGNVGIGIGTATPANKLEVAGSVKIVDGTEGVGKVLTSDASGKATWAPVSVVTASALSGQSLVNVTTVPTNIGTALATFTKLYDDSRVQVIVQTHLYVEDMTSTVAVRYELQLGNTAALVNSGRAHYFIDNAGAGYIVQNSTNATIIAEFPAVIAGTYNINMLVSAVNAGGSALNAYIDPGIFSASSIIIKEYR